MRLSEQASSGILRPKVESKFRIGIVLSLPSPRSLSLCRGVCLSPCGHLNLFTYRGKTVRCLVYTLLRTASPPGAFELANQFNRAVGRSKKIIGAGRLFKIRGPRIVSGSQPYRNSTCASAAIRRGRRYHSLSSSELFARSNLRVAVLLRNSSPKALGSKLLSAFPSPRQSLLPHQSAKEMILLLINCDFHLIDPQFI